MFWNKKKRRVASRDNSSSPLQIAAKKNHPEKKPHNFRSKIIRMLLVITIIIALVVFAVIALFGTLLSVETKKNILLINTNIDGKIGEFSFASINTSADNNKLAVVSVKDQLNLVPSSLVLNDTQTLRLKLIQASLQSGVLIDEIWEVNSLNYDSDSPKRFFLDSWKQNTSYTSLQWWTARLKIQDRQVVTDQIDDIHSLSEYDLTPAEAEIARQCSVAVVNTTEKSGVANFLTNYLEKKGVVVVRVTDNNSQLEGSRVVLAEESEACLAVVSVLQYLQPEDTSVSINQEVANSVRASAVFFLGKDISELQETW